MLGTLACESVLFGYPFEFNDLDHEAHLRCNDKANSKPLWCKCKHFVALRSSVALSLCPSSAPYTMQFIPFTSLAFASLASAFPSALLAKLAEEGKAGAASPSAVQKRAVFDAADVSIAETGTPRTHR